MIKAVLFDLDDTLTDRPTTLSKYSALFHREFAGLLDTVTTGDIESTITELDEHGYRPREEVYAGILDRLAWVLAPDHSAIRNHWNTWFLQSTAATRGLQQTLAALAGANLRLGVVTNGSVLTQSAKIEQLGIRHYFATVIISESVQCKKPFPQIFQYALDEIGSFAGEALFVGDHPVNDVLGSAEAGLIPVWFEGVHAWPTSRAIPERRIRALPEALEFINPRR